MATAAWALTGYREGKVMKPLKNILAVIDLTTERHPALDKARVLARATGATLELFVCHYDQYISGQRFFDSPGLKRAREDAVERRLQRLEKLAEPLREEAFSVTCDVVWDHPLDEGIVRKALKTKPDLVIKATEYHHKLGQALFTPTDWNLIRHLPVPLLLVKPEAWTAQPIILAAVDPLHEHDKPASLDHSILTLARHFAADLNGHVHVFHSCTPVVMPPAGGAPEPVMLPVDKVEADLEKVHRDAMAKLARDHDIADERLHIFVGRTRYELKELAQQLGAAIVVMGAVARNALARVFIGSTAEKVLDKLPCDVLVVKPETFATPVEALPLDEPTVEEETQHQISV